MNTTTIEHGQHTTASKVGYVIMGLVYAIVVYQASVIIVAIIINFTGVTDLIRFSTLIQFSAGISLSLIAYGTVANHSVKLGMRVCYGLVIGALFVIGGYTILTSLMSL